MAALEEAAEPIAVNGWFCETDLSGEDAPAAPQPHVVSAASYGGALEQARLSTPNDYTLEAVRCRPVEADARYAGADHVHEGEWECTAVQTRRVWSHGAGSTIRVATYDPAYGFRLQPVMAARRSEAEAIIEADLMERWGIGDNWLALAIDADCEWTG